MRDIGRGTQFSIAVTPSGGGPHTGESDCEKRGMRLRGTVWRGRAVDGSGGWKEFDNEATRVLTLRLRGVDGWGQSV